MIPRPHKEAPGVISQGPCWVIFHGPWMYGPTDTLIGCLWVMATEWKRDRHLVG